MTTDNLNIVEGNKLIAEFDGWYRKLEVNKGSDLNWFHKEHSTQITANTLIPSRPRNFKYHSSWDWIMPCCIKMIRLSPEKCSLLREYLGNCDIDKVYKQLIFLIKNLDFQQEPESNCNLSHPNQLTQQIKKRYENKSRTHKRNAKA